MLQRFLLPAAAALLLQASIVPAADPSARAATQRSVSLDDIAATKAPGDPNFSPNGKLIAYALDDRIYVVPVDRGVPRSVTSAGSKAWDPRWSRDGRTLYFLSDRGGTSQLWKLPVEGFGEATQVTTFAHGIESLTSSPDESKLLLRFTESALKEPAGKDAKAAKKDEKPEPWVITRLEFKEDAGDGYVTGDRAEHLYSFDLASGKLTLNAELFYQSLRSRGIDTQLVVYPGMHHSDWSEEFDKDYLRRVREWFDKFLK